MLWQSERKPSLVFDERANLSMVTITGEGSAQDGVALYGHIDGRRHENIKDWWLYMIAVLLSSQLFASRSELSEVYPMSRRALLTVQYYSRCGE
jgi:hypothetical protein